MKTAMEELIEIMMYEWGEGRGLPEWTESALKKEKEQILEAYDKGISDHQWNDYNPEEYYNQTYNQDRKLPKDLKDMLDNL